MVNTKKLIKKTSLASLSLAAILLTSPAALADTASNNTTGADSTNNATTATTTETNIATENNATVNNNLTIKANTGGNSASENTGSGSISTGDITGSVMLTNNVNSSNINPPTCCAATDNSSSNTKTGADSTNNSSVEVNNNLNITQIGNMHINNNIFAGLNTGDNFADQNTGDGTIRTGDVNFQIGVTNRGNENSIGTVTNPSNQDENQTNNPAGQVLAAAIGAGSLPVTGGSLPFLQVSLLVLAGLALRLTEGKLRGRFLQI